VTSWHFMRICIYIFFYPHDKADFRGIRQTILDARSLWMLLPIVKSPVTSIFLWYSFGFNKILRNPFLLFLFGLFATRLHPSEIKSGIAKRSFTGT